jgi:acyl-CoA dehydrogenase
MSGLLWTLFFVTTLWALFYFRTPLSIGSILFAIALLFWQEFSQAPVFFKILGWLAFLAVAIPLNVTPWRRLLVSDRVLAIFRNIMPSMSQTEREALEAGNVWWDG